MKNKPFKKMTLGEVFDLEKKHEVSIGRSKNTSCNHKEKDECNCFCHVVNTAFTVHVVACCRPCPKCGIKIRRGVFLKGL